MKLKGRRTMIIIITIVVLICILFYFATGLRRTYAAEVKYSMSTYYEAHSDILTRDDMEPLPEPVQKYLSYSGVVGKPKVWNFKAVMEGRMVANSDKWMKVTAEQYNYLKNPTRMFYIRANMFGIPCFGLHAYKNETGTMLVKVLGLVPVVNGKGKEMNEGDCVTLFNDMCILAPASLIDKRITWETIDDLSVKAIFTNGSIKVSAILYFNEKGELINFVSDDRYLSATGATYEKLRWSTPSRDYREYNGVKHPSYGEAVWTMPDGSLFKYGEFKIKSVEYNCNEMK